MNIVLLVGGVGGAKLALGFQQILPPEQLRIIVNTGDDMWHHGLRICPDIDTVLYTLSGRVDQQNGWGVAEDTTTTLETLRALGADAWFRLGDKDIATHLYRSARLREGWVLTDVIDALRRAMGIAPRILPMTDDEVATIVDTVEYGELEFQDYFVRHRWQPRIRELRYVGADDARLTPAVADALQWAQAVIIAPSNPWLSIAPMLAMRDFYEALMARHIPRIAVTPIVQGKALKGPAAKLMAELGHEPSPESVLRFYDDVLTGFVYDERDGLRESYAKRTLALDTIMLTDADKARVAQALMDWLAQW